MSVSVNTNSTPTAYNPDVTSTTGQAPPQEAEQSPTATTDLAVVDTFESPVASTTIDCPPCMPPDGDLDCGQLDSVLGSLSELFSSLLNAFTEALAIPAKLLGAVATMVGELATSLGECLSGIVDPDDDCCEDDWGSDKVGDDGGVGDVEDAGDDETQEAMEKIH